MNKTKALILLTVFIDILGIGIVIPVLPFFVKSFGVSDFVVTSLFAVYALFSFLSGPFLGSISDRYGRRPVLLLSILSSSIGWFVFASAQNIIWLFTGRIIDGLAAGNITTAQSYMADISKDEKERVSNMGLIGVMFGVGLIIGPFIGGLLGHFGHNIPFFAVGALSLINVILAYFFLPETHHKRSSETLSLNPLTPIVRALRNPIISPIMFAWFLFSISFSIQQSIFALYINKVFGLQELGAGLIFSSVGIVMILNQVFLLRQFWLAKFSNKKLLDIMLVIFGFGFFMISIPIGVVFAIGMIFTFLGQSLIRTVMSGTISNIEKERRGENLGNMNAFMSLAMIVGPFLGGFLFTLNTHLPFIASGVFAFLALIAIHVSKIYSEI